MQRIAINGFGRIGRNVLRAWFEHKQGFDFDIVAINDIADSQTLAHLLRYDTTHGRFAGDIHVQQHIEHGQTCEYLVVSQGQRQLNIRLLQHAQPKEIAWQQLNVDVVLECTGLFRSRADASQHLHAGAKRVIIGAAPFDSVDIAVVYGVNHHDVQAHHQLISSVSCTTQALVPLIKILDDFCGIESALMTEIHAVTADQSVLDHAHRDLRRARASGYNIIPTTSSALGALKQVFPHMAGRVEGYSIRVPTVNVAAIDLTFIAQRETNLEQLHQQLRHAATHDYQAIMSVVDAPLVSSDFNHSAESLIVDFNQSFQIGRQFKIFAWYDNEWGYANRLLDLCQSFLKS
ncbi:MAG: glyceraldehyde 3-phosphate dehydrogenase NAD-binding domain-containing protein [Acinetobacter sp.]|nr:glyceraldehyde 3-phosphate dehydrogenase NAD-binding domain-containing protein [Acinetobacter sp.]